MSTYPEHDKLQEIKDASEAIGEFLQHHADKGVRLCHWLPYWKNAEPHFVKPDGSPGGFSDFDAMPNPEFDERLEGFYPIPGNTEELLASYFGIDLRKLEEEKREMLAALRAANAPEREGR